MRYEGGYTTRITDNISRLRDTPDRSKPKLITEYAKSTRQMILKYLAVLRWKAAVDSTHYGPAPTPIPTVGSTTAAAQSPTAPSGVASYPTPYSNAESNDSPSHANTYTAKGKGKASDGISEVERVVVKGRVSEARRAIEFVKHANMQHEAAVGHAKHVVGVVESLR